MEKEKFLYDVVVCTFNGACYISQQIESILGQSLLPQKIIISDDGSSDDTIEIIECIFRNKHFKNYSIYKNDRLGVVDNFLFAIMESTSEFIFLSDQDDFWEKDKVDLFRDAFESCDKTTPLLVFSDATLIDKNNKVISNSFFSYQGLSPACFDDDSIIYKNCVQGASCAFNREMKKLLYFSLGVINKKNLYMHDWWIAILAKYYGNSIFINKPLINYRQHSKNQIGVYNKKRVFIYYLIYFRKYFYNFYKAILQKRELDKLNTHIPSHLYRKKSYKHVPYLKRIIVKILRLS